MQQLEPRLIHPPPSSSSNPNVTTAALITIMHAAPLLRPPPLPPLLHAHRYRPSPSPSKRNPPPSFSTTPHPSQDHYATLALPPTATPADIKKSFYALSKRHHPDRNPSDPDAANAKFIAVSTAYAVLSDPAQRAAYDREHAPAAPRPTGSYSSASPGGRPASGLSRRRGSFRGPPPSFYRAGGWGGAQTKRQRAADADGRAGWERMRREEEVRRQGGRVDEGGDGAWPFGAQDANDVPHFDRAGHFRRTATVEEQLRQGRRRRRPRIVEEVMEVGAGTEVRSFLLIGAVIVVGVGAPFVFMARTKGLG